MELPLLPEPEAGATLESLHRCRGQLVHLHARGPCRFELAIQVFFLRTLAKEEIAINPLEGACQVLELADRLDSIDGRAMAVAGETRTVRPVQPQNLFVAVVDLVRQVRGRDGGLPRANRDRVDDDYGSSFTRELIRGCEARDR